MQVLQLLWTGVGTDVPPQVTYYVLRVLMFILSFVLEDWAIHDLVQSPRYQRLAATLVASSYVTWTYQTHTFSNSVETLAVLWSLVMIQRIRDTKVCASLENIFRLLLTGLANQPSPLTSHTRCHPGFWLLQPHHLHCLHSRSAPLSRSALRKTVQAFLSCELVKTDRVTGL